VKRGLVVLDDAQTPLAEIAARVERLRARLRREGFALALIYGDVSRSDDINYLTNLCIYWNEGVLAMPARGEPALLSKLSKRVHPWMRTSSTLTDLRSGREIARLVREFAAEQGAGDAPRIGLVEQAWWPAPLVEQLRAGLPTAELVDLGDVVREQRAKPSRSETALLRRAGETLGAAVEEAAEAALEATPGERIAIVELQARGAGFTDVLPFAEAGEDGRVTVDVTGQLRHVWVRAARTRGGVHADALAAAQAAVGEQLYAGARPSQLQDAARAAAARACGSGAGGAGGNGAGGDAASSLTLRCIDAADLATAGGQRALADPDAPLQAGAVVAALVEIAEPDGRRAVGCETWAVGDGTAAAQPLTKGGDRARVG
jgi:hypothetical protein